ncbi:hypothetical protein COCC4DRAFT_27063 [Bipolaris maydis ATCC 48331]|uniref:Protein kinase domain-containing protein n=2 Tax=Cochliobolus heterostrophus TaxID=5016 RepID=M2UVI8_COCH5|nr:uncharacterized protein COCC4DRAFT_27063 [Bipolaris maydis ATCC 48331]EMD97596.1 hypothetical protein COCHEDRAFT_1025988 [Bipolaris maydis C5]ENI01094.1 hypothetical protein COCC4DRAFT_27063 [Bipolaris maydis ATCC 48331]KAJ5031708.1 kinase-like domain-containing protein [Bipolaris maydis]KAJ6273434.1 kinase-like domain-containing protein [Bipolaris maydis]
MPIPTNNTTTTMNSIEDAFKRLPRPQRVLDPTRPRVPTTVALLAQKNGHRDDFMKTHSAVPPLPLSELPPYPQPHSPLLASPLVTHQPVPRLAIGHVSPLREHKTALESNVSKGSNRSELLTLGHFKQNDIEWAVQSSKRCKGLVMVKKVFRKDGIVEKDILERLQHPNITKLVSSIYEDDMMLLTFEYCRFSLIEVMSVHIKLEELQVQCIATSIFNALSYLSRHNIVHGSVGSHSIRITTPDFRIVLSDFSKSTVKDKKIQSGNDLVDLGFVLMECMEGRSLPPHKRSLSFVKSQRERNKVFGLHNAENWSGSKNLIDFLDELFNEKRSADAKYTRPHKFVSSKNEDSEWLQAFVELCTLELFTSWVPKMES